MSDLARMQENRTLWVGDLEQWMEETYLVGVFSPVGNIKNVKIIRHGRSAAQTGSYAFVEFESRADVRKLMDQLSGEPLTAPDGHRFRLNWAMYGIGGQAQGSVDVSVYVGNLDAVVKDAQLFNLFASKYKSVCTSKVIFDNNLQHSKGFGFVRFKDAEEAEKSLSEMQGVYLKGRPIKVRPAMRTFGQEGGYGRQSQWHGAEAVAQSGSNAPPDNHPFKMPPPPPRPPSNYAEHLQQQASLAEQVGVVPPPQPAITNMTTAQAQIQAWQQVGEAQATQADGGHTEGSRAPPVLEVPSLEHFQALLHHPYFVQAFEQELASGVSGTGSSVFLSAPRLSRLLCDRPEEFNRTPSVECQNDEFLAGLDSTGGLGSRAVPMLPDELRVAV